IRLGVHVEHHCLATSSGISQHFFDCCVAGKNAAQAVLPQGDHSKLDRLLLNRYRRRALVDQFTDWVAYFQKLVNPFSSFVPRVVTSVATFAVEELFVAYVLARDAQLGKYSFVWLIGSAAIATDAAQQSLTKNRLQR